MQPLRHGLKKSNNSISYVGRPKKHSRLKRKNGKTFSFASPNWKPRSQKLISYAHALRNSSRLKDGSLGWKYNSTLEQSSSRPPYTNPKANGPTGNGESPNSNVSSRS